MMAISCVYTQVDGVFGAVRLHVSLPCLFQVRDWSAFFICYDIWLSDRSCTSNHRGLGWIKRSCSRVNPRPVEPQAAFQSLDVPTYVLGALAALDLFQS